MLIDVFLAANIRRFVRRLGRLQTIFVHDNPIAGFIGILRGAGERFVKIGLIERFPKHGGVFGRLVLVQVRRRYRRLGLDRSHRLVKLLAQLTKGVGDLGKPRRPRNHLLRGGFAVRPRFTQKRRRTHKTIFKLARLCMRPGDFFGRLYAQRIQLLLDVSKRRTRFLDPRLHQVARSAQAVDFLIKRIAFLLGAFDRRKQLLLIANDLVALLPEFIAFGTDHVAIHMRLLNLGLAIPLDIRDFLFETRTLLNKNRLLGFELRLHAMDLLTGKTEFILRGGGRDSGGEGHLELLNLAHMFGFRLGEQSPIRFDLVQQPLGAPEKPIGLLARALAILAGRFQRVAQRPLLGVQRRYPAFGLFQLRPKRGHLLTFRFKPAQVAVQPLRVLGGGGGLSVRQIKIGMQMTPFLRSRTFRGDVHHFTQRLELTLRIRKLLAEAFLMRLRHGQFPFRVFPGGSIGRRRSGFARGVGRGLRGSVLEQSAQFGNFLLLPANDFFAFARRTLRQNVHAVFRTDRRYRDDVALGNTLLGAFR